MIGIILKCPVKNMQSKKFYGRIYQKEVFLNRVKFFSTNDMSSGMMLEKVPVIIEAFSEDICFKDVNDALEFYNIYLFIRNELWLLSWSEEFKERLRDLKKPIYECVAKFFSVLDNDTFITLLTQTDNIYIDDLLSIICNIEVVKKISWLTIDTALRNRLIHLYQLLNHKRLVDLYNLDLRQTILSNPTNAELILSTLSDTIGTAPKYFFPKELTDADVNKLFIEYIDSPDPNSNYIQQIANYKNGSNIFKITKEVIYAARNKYDLLVRAIFEVLPANKFDYSVSFCQQNKTKSFSKDGSKFEFSYDSNWITNHLEYLEILYNFAYLFEWFDWQFGIALISNPNSASLMEKLVGGRNKSDYFTYIGFEMINELAIQQLKGYYHVLQNSGILLEDVFRWYYTEYLDEEFGIKGFHVSLPSNDKSYYEKCKSIAPEFESILKQYASLCKLNSIDHRYIENVNPQISYTKLPSLCNNNYGYPNSDEIKLSMFSLFSSQSSCYYLQDLGDENEDCLFNQIQKHDIKYSSFETWQTREIDQLINLGILKITANDEVLQINDINSVMILKILFQNGFISVHNHSEEMILALEKFINQEHISTGSSLLSIQEGNYFDYHLNDSTFGNSLSLRNKYSHGTPGKNSERDYFIFLKLLTLLTIKIDNDLQNSDRNFSTE